MEVVSTLCFRGQEAPHPELIKSLVDTIFSERPEEEEGGMDTRELTYSKSKEDKVPVIRSFLLQLLLEHKLVVMGLLTL